MCVWYPDNPTGDKMAVRKSNVHHSHVEQRRILLKAVVVEHVGETATRILLHMMFFFWWCLPQGYAKAGYGVRMQDYAVHDKFDGVPCTRIAGVKAKVTLLECGIAAVATATSGNRA